MRQQGASFLYGINPQTNQIVIIALPSRVVAQSESIVVPNQRQDERRNCLRSLMACIRRLFVIARPEDGNDENR